MQITYDLDGFIKSTGQQVFIEAEGTPEKIDCFIRDYNEKYKPIITMRTDGIICLKPNANKWGLELRLYLYSNQGIPDGLSITHNNAYRGDYSFRINDNQVIKELFDLGYRIGAN